MKIVKLLILVAAFQFTFSGCKKSEEEEVLTGRYSIVSAQSDRSVDINMDGQSTRDMLVEMPALKNATLGLNVNNSRLFDMFWPKESFHSRDGRVVPDGYDPNLFVNYDLDAIIGYYSYDKSSREIVVDKKSDNEKPESIRVISEGEIEAIFSKKVYTRSGWEDITFTILYKRFTDRF